MLRKLAFCLLAGTVAVAHAQTSAVSELLQIDIADAGEQEIVVLEVTYQPGGRSPPHRHNAHTIVYVLEGSVVMQVAGGDKQMLKPGQVFHENPDDIHSVSMNASDTEPAKILVFFVKKQGAPVTVPAT